MPAIKAGCLTTSEICCDSGFSWLMDSVTRPEASEIVIGADVRTGLGGDKDTSAGANEDKALERMWAQRRKE